MGDCTDGDIAAIVIKDFLLGVASVISCFSIYRLYKMHVDPNMALPLILLKSMLCMFTFVILTFIFDVAKQFYLCLNPPTRHRESVFDILHAFVLLFTDYQWLCFNLVLYYRLKIVFEPTLGALTKTCRVSFRVTITFLLVMGLIRVLLRGVTNKDHTDTLYQLLFTLTLIVNLVFSQTLAITFIRKLYLFTKLYVMHGGGGGGDDGQFGDVDEASDRARDVLANYAIIVRNTILSVVSSIVTFLFVIIFILVLSFDEPVEGEVIHVGFAISGLDTLTNVTCIALSLPFYNHAYRFWCGSIDAWVRKCGQQNLVIMKELVVNNNNETTATATSTK